MCESIATLRRRLQRVPKSRLVFIDESHARISIAPTRTLVAPGHAAYTVVEDTTKYASRYDMIAWCSADRVFPSVIYTPEERARAEVKGINQAMLLDSMKRYLAPEFRKMGLAPITLVMDKSNVHNPAKIKQALADGGCRAEVDVVLMPTQAAKRMSPLDNSLFATWKARVKKHVPLTKDNIVNFMYGEWEKLTATDITPHYHHCLLMQRQNVYADCPESAAHQHQ